MKIARFYLFLIPVPFIPNAISEFFTTIFSSILYLNGVDLKINIPLININFIFHRKKVRRFTGCSLEQWDECLIHSQENVGWLHFEHENWEVYLWRDSFDRENQCKK